MNTKDITKALEAIKKNSPKRNFTQAIDLVVNLRDIDVKKNDQQINVYTALHHSKGKPSKVCALVGPELLDQAKEVCDHAVSVDEFEQYQDKKKAKKLATSYDYFIAQATIMPKVAQAFGRVFGPKGKMPNPKAGCVVPPNANLKPLYERLQKTVHLQTKNDPMIHAVVGNESMKDDEIINNIQTVYDSLVQNAPSGKNNIRNAFLKLTMGKSVMVGGEIEVDDKKAPKAEKPAEEPKAEPKEDAPAKEAEE